jgi:SulP family sulfate permease
VTFGATIAVTLLHLPVETIGTVRRNSQRPTGVCDSQLALQRSEPAVVARIHRGDAGCNRIADDSRSFRPDEQGQAQPNVELMAQGIANIVSPLFGGLPATGAIARTATNIRAGAKTPVAAMIHALTLLAVVLFAAPLVKNVPLAALAAILMMVAYNMGEWREIPEILKLTAADITVWILTLTLTVVAPLTFAVEVGMVLAALTDIRKVSRTTTVARVTRGYVEDSRMHILQGKDIPEYGRFSSPRTILVRIDRQICRNT